MTILNKIIIRKAGRSEAVFANPLVIKNWRSLSWPTPYLPNHAEKYTESLDRKSRPTVGIRNVSDPQPFYAKSDSDPAENLNSDPGSS
jgi:hypothetical protein